MSGPEALKANRPQKDRPAAGDTFESEEMSAKCPSKYEEQSEIKGAAEKPVTKT